MEVDRTTALLPQRENQIIPNTEQFLNIHGNERIKFFDDQGGEFMIDYSSIFGYVPNIALTLEQHLKNYSEIEVNAMSLLESFHTIREKMIVNLRPIIALFPHYSEHSHEHSEHIISAIEKLLGRGRIEKLLPADTWMLLVCAYMHDLGMLVQGKELELDWQTTEFQEHIANCMSSNDDDLKKAASNVTSVEWMNHSSSWPVYVYRDVILLASEFYRRKHPERAKILPQRTELKQALNTVMYGNGKIPQRIQETVGKICFSHGISFDEMLNLLEPEDSLLGYVFHPRFIAALLCIGDLCDLDNGRFNTMAIEVFGGLAKNNLVHYYKHESVSSFVIQKDMISVNFDIQNRRIKEEIKNKSIFAKSDDNGLQDFCDMILLETQNWIRWMVDIVENIKLRWNDFYILDIDAMTPSLNYKILVDGKETISSRKNMRFSFSNEKAYELIEGYNLYNNNFVFVRELLQNSMDALKKQFWSDILSGRWNHLLKHLEVDGQIDYAKIQPFDFSDKEVYDYYQVKMHIEHKEDDPFAYFVIEDNGTGISKEDVEERIINTGAHSDLHNIVLKEMPEWLKPTSAFGIGLHSVFAVADTVFIQTRTEFDKTVYNINMHSGKRDGYIFMSIAENQNFRFCNCTHGTQIKFAINISNCANNTGKNSQPEDDPLAERSESNFCEQLQNALKSMLDVSLFLVTFKFNSNNEITYNKLYEDRYMRLFFNKDNRNNIFGKSYNNDYYDFVLGMCGQYIVLWDRQRAVTMSYSLFRFTNYRCFVVCKGFIVKNANISTDDYNSLPDRIDYWGGDTKNILNISRDSLTQEQLVKNREIFSQARSYQAEIYYLVLDSLLKNNGIKEWHNDIGLFMENWLLKKTNNIETPNLFEDINVLLDKYKNFMLSRNEMQCLILRHGFCLLLKSCKNQIQAVLNSLDEDDRIEYIFNGKTLNKQKKINKIIKDQTYFFDFLDEIKKTYDNEYDQIYMYNLINRIVRAEYTDVFINLSSDELYKIVKNYHFSMDECIFGSIYTSLSRDISTMYPNKYQEYYTERLEKETTGYIPKPLDVYWSVPLTNIICLLIIANKDILPLKDALMTELSYIPGYENSYGFSDVNNVGDIIMSSQLRIEEGKYTSNLVKYFPFLHWLSCKSIRLNADGKMILQFGNTYENTGVVKYLDKKKKKMLYSHSHMNVVPIPAGYEDIAVNQRAVSGVRWEDYHESLFLPGNYITYLWDDFINIREEYGPRIAAGDEKETIVNEIMPKSRTDNKPTLNLLRYIYHHRAYNNDLGFEEAWEKIYETYKRFVAMVLDCISI